MTSTAKPATPTTSAVAERGAPPEPAVQLRDDCEREPAAGEPHPAVEALREGRPARFAHVRAAGDEAQAGADPDQRPGPDRERRLRRDERQAVERNRDDEPDESGAPRAEAIGGASSRDLHREMGDEERRREQPDDREAHVVGVGELRRDRADVGDVPAGGEADRAASEDGASHAARA